MSLAFTTAILAKLQADDDLMGRIKYLGDEAPPDQEGPYIEIGMEQDVRGNLLDESDMKHYVTLDVWSSYKGRKEVKEILTLLRADFESMDDFHMEEMRVLQDSASGWWHGIISYYTWLYD